MGCEHPWRLVAPWWRWARQQADEGRAPRATRPVFQKYDSSDPVSAFVKDPQLSLKFIADDFVQQVTALAQSTVPSGPLAGLKRRFATSTVTPTTLRKLFLPTHKRFYLVVCQLHCDVAGFPRADRADACQAGFVVRRRYVSYPAGSEAEARGIVQSITALTAQLQLLDDHAKGLATGRKQKVQVVKLLGAGMQATLEERRAEIEAKVKAERAKLEAWKATSGAAWVHEGWVPTGFEKIGAWQAVEEAPQTLVEAFYPLYPLVPDPAQPGHAGAGATVYFGMVPTGGADTDVLGNARFDDQRTYEVRCFVRQHRCGCPRRDVPNDCDGTLVWTLPTEEYRLAPHFDLVGTGNRPVTIQLPDLNELAAQAMALPPGQGMPVKMVTQDGSAMNFSVDADGKPGGGSLGPGQICSFAIPLITLVATFVLKLFLPILMFLFGLFWMLKLKFCILPSVSFDAGIDLALKVTPPSIDLDVDLSVSVTADLHLDLAAEFDAVFEASAPDGSGGVGAVLAADYGNEALVEFRTGVKADELPTDPAEVEAGDVTLVTGLEYEEKVDARLVLA